MMFQTNEENPHPWLRVEDGGTTWHLRDEPDSPKGEMKIMWSERLPDGSRLTDVVHEHLLTTIQTVVVRMRVGDKRGARKRSNSALMQYQIARALIALVRWMHRRGKRRFSHLTISDFEDYKVDIRGGANALDDPVGRLRELAEEYLRVGRAPPMRFHGRRQHFHRTAFLQEAGLPTRLNDSSISHELSRIEFEVFKLPQQFPNEGTKLCYENGPPGPQVVQRETLLKYMYSWEMLWQYGDHLPDRLSFNPYEGTTAYDVACELGETGERTPNIPPRLALWLLELCVRWVLHYGPELLSIREELIALEPELRRRHPDPGTRAQKRAEVIRQFEKTATRGLGDPWPLASTTFTGSKMAQEGRLGLHAALNTYLATACFVVICAFSARRHSEVDSLREDEKLAVYTGDPGRRYLTIWIEKSRKKWDQVPVPEIVVLAIELLRRLGAGASMKSGRKLLFQFLRWTGTADVFHGKYLVPEFATWLQERAPLPDGGIEQAWRLTPHQLRRFFAFTYFHHWENADLAALSWVLRHNNLEQTLRYCLENVPGEAMAQTAIREVQHERTVAMLTEVAIGKRPAGGRFASRFIADITRELDAELERLRETLGSSITVIGQHQVGPVVERWTTEHGIELGPTEHIECTCRATLEDSVMAPCNGPELLLKGFLVQLGPNRGVAKPSVCANCPHGLILQHHAPVYQRQLVSLEREANSPQTPPILASSSRAEAGVLSGIIQSNPQLFAVEDERNG